MRSAHTTILVTGANSGLGFAICCRLIDDFLFTRPHTERLTLLFSTRDAPKSADTLVRLKGHIQRTHNKGISRDEVAAQERVKLEGVSVDLTQLSTVKKLAVKLLTTGRTIDAVVCNAGIGGWLGTNFPAALWAMAKNLIQATTYPTFQYSDVGALAVQKDAKSLAKFPDQELPPLGQVFTANVFGHYLLVHWLAPLLGSSSRIVWITSTTALPRFFSLDDIQCLHGNDPYESSKRLTDLLVLTSELPSTKPYVRSFLPGPAPSQQPTMYTTHPGILKTNIAPVPWFMDLANLLVLYLVRLVGSPWHTVNAYPAAVSATFCALAPPEQLADIEKHEGKGKWGSAVDWKGNESVRRMEVDGWGFCGKTGVVPHGSVNKRRSRWSDYKETGKEERERFEIDGREAWKQMEALREEWEARLGALSYDPTG